MTTRRPLLAIILLLAASAVPAAAQQPAERAEFVPAWEGAPFSELVRVGNTIYLSGMLGIADGALVGGGIQPETRQTMENIRASLERVGASMDDVVKCTVFLADIAEWAAMNEVYVTFFPRHRPARSALGASGLALDARVEIECIAVHGAGGAPARAGGS